MHKKCRFPLSFFVLIVFSPEAVETGVAVGAVDHQRFHGNEAEGAVLFDLALAAGFVKLAGFLRGVEHDDAAVLLLGDGADIVPAVGENADDAAAVFLVAADVAHDRAAGAQAMAHALGVVRAFPLEVQALGQSGCIALIVRADNYIKHKVFNAEFAEFAFKLV